MAAGARPSPRCVRRSEGRGRGGRARMLRAAASAHACMHARTHACMPGTRRAGRRRIWMDAWCVGGGRSTMTMRPELRGRAAAPASSSSSSSSTTTSSPPPPCGGPTLLDDEAGGLQVADCHLRLGAPARPEAGEGMGLSAICRRARARWNRAPSESA
eukprot:scaffold910_cov396-Prasinococcus_capsulatus_cf.AAC.44